SGRATASTRTETPCSSFEREYEGRRRRSTGWRGTRASPLPPDASLAEMLHCCRGPGVPPPGPRRFQGTPASSAARDRRRAEPGRAGSRARASTLHSCSTRAARSCRARSRGRTVMKAIRAHGFGGPEVLHLDEIPRPDPGPGDVLVRVLASSVNPIDWKL